MTNNVEWTVERPNVFSSDREYIGALEDALCKALGCDRESLVAGFELGDSDDEVRGEDPPASVKRFADHHVIRRVEEINETIKRLAPSDFDWIFIGWSTTGTVGIASSQSYGRYPAVRTAIEALQQAAAESAWPSLESEAST